MISVLIPLYNCRIKKLVSALRSQLIKSGVKFEIIIIDDNSDKEFIDTNEEVALLENVRLIKENKNIGRSKIRNKLANLSVYPYLLFLDSDVEIDREDFIENYLKECTENVLVCGGISYYNNKPDKDRYLRWVYGKSREEVSMEKRTANPNKSFMTGNFLISGSIFEKIKFNEELSGYGHEDTLFGYEMKKHKIIVKHINNPVVHIGLETNSEFLEKTKEGIRNLQLILRINGHEKYLINDIRLLRIYRYLEKTRLKQLIGILFSKSEIVLSKNLLGKKPNMHLFDLYKLGYICTLR